MSTNPSLRFLPFVSANKVILSAQQQPQQQTATQQNLTLRQIRKSATPTNIPVSTTKAFTRENKSVQNTKYSNFSDNDDYSDNELDIDTNLSKEDRYVLLQPRKEPQGQENYLSGNVTPVNTADTQRKTGFFNFIQKDIFFQCLFFRTEYLRVVDVLPPLKKSLFKCFH